MPRAALALLASFLLFGCGGSGDGSSRFLSGTVGAASVDLALVRTPAAGMISPASPSMRGSGRSTGRVRLQDSTPDGAGFLRIDTVVEPAPITNGKVVLQEFTVGFAHAAALAVGDVFALDGDSVLAGYDEATYDTDGTALSNGEKVSWHATGGTMEVTARSGLSIAFKLTNVTLEGADASLAPFTLSGTISGTFEVSP